MSFDVCFVRAVLHACLAFFRSTMSLLLGAASRLLLRRRATAPAAAADLEELQCLRPKLRLQITESEPVGGNNNHQLPVFSEYL
jgi:hypothetical protein